MSSGEFQKNSYQELYRKTLLFRGRGKVRKVELCGIKSSGMFRVLLPLCLLFLLLLNSVCLSKELPKYSGVSLPDFVTSDFVGSSRCAVCHDLLVDAVGNDVSIVNHWRSTMMANAARDPFWQAKVASEVYRIPGIRNIIEEKCAICHMPMAFIQAKAANEKYSILGNGLLNPTAKLHEAAIDGVSCALCHQIQDKNLGKKKSFSGEFSIDTSTSPPDRKIYGPYREPLVKPMRTSVGFTPEFGLHTNDSAFCATCHTLFTPFLDDQGNIAGEFPEQTPYLEWRHSSFGIADGKRYELGENMGQERACQDCHMPHTPPGGVKIAKWAPPEVKEREHFSQHHFVGGNTLLLDILINNASALHLTASTTHLNDTKKRTLNQLKRKSAIVTIENTKISRHVMRATVSVNPLTGHKLPTGFPSRRLWLHVIIIDKQGNVVFESGNPFIDGRISGNNNDENPTSYEPHYDLITKPDQVQIYETIMVDSNNIITYTLLQAARYIKDNRLLPDGFDKKTASAEIGVYGAAANDDDFIGGTDQVTYEVDIVDHKGPFTFKAELLYQSLTPAFMDDLKYDNVLPLVDSFSRMYDQADKSPVAMATVETEIR